MSSEKKFIYWKPEKKISFWNMTFFSEKNPIKSFIWHTVPTGNKNQNKNENTRSYKKVY